MPKKQRGEEPTPHPVIAFSDVLLDSGEHFLDGRRFEFLERFGLDLADSFPRDREILANLFQSARLIVANSETEPNNSLFSGREIFQNTVELMCHFRAMHMRIRGHRLQIRQQLPELRSAIPDRMLQGHWFLERLDRLMESFRPHA